ncbi:lantibiotic dehydratase [Streptomyces lavendulae subsp. lavendulae]|uniref:lantibiotic dehydratase n=1 Tax=Streptomyces lavendulae TaxID=1914 RepID=UPI0024A1D4ED|nr:lantibiotic dehydratase [Streptomyces lavendulae]GLV87478.1 lantibiotic dehydratase [Streptomyces lavendulae subsp. lavendulae]
MPDRPFRAVPDLTVRLAAFTADPELLAAVPETTAPYEQKLAFLKRIASTPAVREAIAVSSSSLDRMLDKAAADEELSADRTDRATRAVTRYLLRMVQRPTPFGVQAGVAAAEVAERARFRLGVRHRKSAWPDADWASRVAAAEFDRDRSGDSGLGTCSDTGSGTDGAGPPLVANNLCVVRGARVMLPGTRVQSAASGGGIGETSVKRTKLIAFLLQTCRRATPYADLMARAAAEFPQAPAGAVERAVRGLVSEGFLVAGNHPRQDDAQYAVLARTDASTRSATGPGSWPEQAGRITRMIRAYEDTAVGEGHSAWRAAVEEMRGAAPSERWPPLHVVLAMDAEVAVPPAVLREAEEATAALWRMSPSTRGPRNLTQYHKEFLERYGIERLVPVTELLDPVAGLGAPAGYAMPPSQREPVDTQSDRHRDERLAELVGRALQARERELVLDDATVAGLSFEDADSAAPSLDLCAQLHAESTDALSRGAFSLVLGPACASHMAGALSGRFREVLGRAAVCHPVTGVRVQPAAGEPQPAQLVYRPLLPRPVNISRVPDAAKQRIVIGEFADPEDPSVIPLEDLGIGATFTGFRLRRISTGEELVTVVPHMLNLGTSAPNVARFLGELHMVGLHIWNPWYWGRLEILPFLPRVRHGRTVLAPARWRPSAELTAAAATSDRWEPALRQWRRELDVPAHVELTVDDKRVELDLDHSQHRESFRHELTRHPDLLIMESCGDRETRFGWSGGHANELVIPLVPSAPDTHENHEAAGPKAPTQTVSRESSRTVHHVGGRWLYAHLAAPPVLHEHLLTRELPGLLAALDGSVDSWHFVRYADPDHQLRLRIRAAEHGGSAGFMPAFHDWSRELVARGLVRDVSLHSFEPEEARYGGPEPLEAALALFCADSTAVVGQLQLTASGGLSAAREVLAAASCADMLRQAPFPSWTDWMLTEYRKPPQLSTRPYRADTARFVTGLLTGTAAGAEPVGAVFAGQPLGRAWAARATAMRTYGSALTAAGLPEEDVSRAVSSVLHMHANRVFGLARESEDTAYAILLDAIRSHRARKEH